MASSPTYSIENGKLKETYTQDVVNAYTLVELLQRVSQIDMQMASVQTQVTQLQAEKDKANALVSKYNELNGQN